MRYAVAMSSRFASATKLLALLLLPSIIGPSVYAKTSLHARLDLPRHVVAGKIDVGLELSHAQVTTQIKTQTQAQTTADTTTDSAADSAENTDVASDATTSDNPDNQNNTNEYAIEVRRHNQQSCAFGPLLRVLRVGTREVVYPTNDGEKLVCAQDIRSDTLTTTNALLYNRDLHLETGEYMIEGWLNVLIDGTPVKIPVKPVRLSVR